MRDRFTGLAVGVGDQIALTIDGGLTWAAATSPASGGALTTLSWNGLYWFLGTSNGRFYYSNDDGTTWTRRQGFVGDGTGAMDSIAFLDKYIGVASQTIGGVGYVMITRDGGYNWSRLSLTPASVGVNQLIWCTELLAWGVGEPVTSLGYITKIQVA